MPRRADPTVPTGDSPPSPLVRAAERMVSRIEALANEVEGLRRSNAALRQDVRDAMAAFERGSEVLKPARQPRPAASVEESPRRRRRRGTAAKGRATPAEVTADVVRAVLAKLGEATAGEISAEITSAGVPVSGRAVRFLAERAGAKTVMGDDGRRRYRL